MCLFAQKLQNLKFLSQKINNEKKNDFFFGFADEFI
jgi:hypothetical protein